MFVPDDVISGFQDAFPLLPQLICFEVIPKKSLINILSVKNFINYFLNNHEINCESDFETEEWNNMWFLVKKALNEISFRSF